MTSSEKSWSNCEPGVIEQMVSEQQTAREGVTRRRVLNLVVVGTAGTAVTAFVGNRLLPVSEPVTQISCEQVHENLQAFVDNRIADRYLRGMISRHLFVCPDCQKAYQGMIDGREFQCGGEQEA